MGEDFMYHIWKYDLLRWTAATAGILCAAVILVLFPVLRNEVMSNSNCVAEARPTIVLDAGHGGIDPGAIGVNQAKEKDLNLAIALRLRDILTLNGYKVIMIREDDISVHDAGISRIASIKTSDLKNRLCLINSYPNALALSIHQNFFEQQKYHGAQMFYGRKNPESQKLAEALQAAFRDTIQPDNERVVKRSTSDVYIIHNAESPTVLVECGFLSNPTECQNLCDEEYQQKVAFTIFHGICDYYARQNKEESEEKE